MISAEHELLLSDWICFLKKKKKAKAHVFSERITRKRINRPEENSGQYLPQRKLSNVFLDLCYHVTNHKVIPNVCSGQLFVL